MEYTIQTSDTPNDEKSWETVVEVSRPSKNDQVTNGPEQDIANTTANTDTITAASHPALKTATLKQYVRLHATKTNAQAPGGHNLNIKEIEIMGTNANRNPELDVSAVLNGITADQLTVTDSKIQLPEVPAGAVLTVRGSELENVVTNDGTVTGRNLGARKVTLLLRAAKKSDPSVYAEKNLTVTVPDHSAAYQKRGWVPAVSAPNAKPEVIPSLQEWYGYTGNFTLNADTRIILNDAASVSLDKVAENLKADLKEITGLELAVETGMAPAANSIYIESLAQDRDAVGKEGYTMHTTEKGVQIYAPTYTGCLYGTITAEQILWQAADHNTIPQGLIRDYPAYEIRGVHLDIARTPYRYQQLKDYEKIMLWYKMNEFGLHVNDNDNCNIDEASDETHSGFHRLESKKFPSLKSEIKHVGVPKDQLNPDYYQNDPDYQGNPHYTRKQWQELQAQAKEYGMHVLTEIDLPAHSLLYNKYAEKNPDKIDWLKGGIRHQTHKGGRLELLDLTGPNKDRALRFGKDRPQRRPRSTWFLY